MKKTVSPHNWYTTSRAVRYAGLAWGFRAKRVGESHRSYRNALADFVTPKNPLEAHKIRIGRPYNRWRVADWAALPRPPVHLGETMNEKQRVEFEMTLAEMLCEHLKHITEELADLRKEVVEVHRQVGRLQTIPHRRGLRATEEQP